MRKLIAFVVFGAVLLTTACDDSPGSVAPDETRASRAAVAESGPRDMEDDRGDNLFEFEAMRGNQGPFVGEDGAIRDVSAGGLPWVVDEAEARLDEDFDLKVEVEGLVLDPDDERVPESLRGTNPVPQFRAILSCMTFSDGMRKVMNVQTDPVDATTEGDARIEAMIAPPDPCYAPIVFVTSPGGAWFAVTGF